MIHNVSALPVGMQTAHPQGAKVGKGGVEAAILALFGKALAAQLQARDAASASAPVTPPVAAPVMASALSIPLLPDAPSAVHVDAPDQKDQGSEGQVNPAALLATETWVDPAQLPEAAPVPTAVSASAAAVSSQVQSQVQSQVPSQVPSLTPQGLAEPVVAAASLLAAAQPGLTAKRSQATPNPVLTAESAPEAIEDLPEKGLVPAVAKNPLVLAGMKYLPVTPAGIAANAHAFQNASAQELPAGIQMKAGLGETLDMKALMTSLEGGASVSSAPGAQNIFDGARLASAPPPLSALPVQSQGEALGLSLGASRQVAQLVTPFSQPQWQSELGEKVVWLAGRHGQMAALSLNPPSLGNIEVRLNLSGHDAGAQFFSANPVVREALEAALPRLREMMAEAGLSLGQAMVSSEPFRDRQEAAATQRADGGGDEDAREAGLALASSLGGHAGRRSGLVDLYV